MLKLGPTILLPNIYHRKINVSLRPLYSRYKYVKHNLLHKTDIYFFKKTEVSKTILTYTYARFTLGYPPRSV